MLKKSTHPYHEEDDQAEDEQGISKPLSKDERKDKRASGDLENDPYDKDSLEEMREDDEVDDWEEGFMEGATGKGSGANCPACGKALPAPNRVVEKMVDGEVMLFCSAHCASQGPSQ